MTGERGGKDAPNKRQKIAPAPWLPPEIWGEVFSFLHPQHDRRRLSLVCKAWNKIAWNVLDPAWNDNRAIREASKKGCAESVKRLLKDPRVNPAFRDSRVDRAFARNADSDDYDYYAIIEASANGHTEVVRLLLDDGRADPGNDNYLVIPYDGTTEVVRTGTALDHASMHGHIDTMILLLTDKRVDPAGSSNHPICNACAFGHVDAVKLLLECERVHSTFKTNPYIDFGVLVKTARRRGHENVVKLLLGHFFANPRVASSLNARVELFR